MKYRKKPVVIEAMQWDGTIEGADRVIAWTSKRGIQYMSLGPSIWIQTLEGAMEAQPGDWIIRGVAGEFYPCKPHIFDATYEPVQEGSDD